MLISILSSLTLAEPDISDNSLHAPATGYQRFMWVSEAQSYPKAVLSFRSAMTRFSASSSEHMGFQWGETQLDQAVQFEYKRISVGMEMPVLFYFSNLKEAQTDTKPQLGSIAWNAQYLLRAAEGYYPHVAIAFQHQLPTQSFEIDGRTPDRLRVELRMSSAQNQSHWSFNIGYRQGTQSASSRLPQLYIRSGFGYDVREDMGMAFEFWSTAILQESYGYQNDTEIAWSGFKDWGRFRIKAGLVWNMDEIADKNPCATLGMTYR